MTNTSVNPARSTGVAFFGPNIAIEQLWFFWIMPVAGAVISAVIYKTLLTRKDTKTGNRRLEDEEAGAAGFLVQKRSCAPR